MNMNTKHLVIASLTGGLISTVLVNTPFVNWLNLLLCAGFWIGPVVAVWLYRRQDGTVNFSQAMLIGMLAGVWHGLIGVLLSPLGLAGAGGVLNGLQQILPAQDLPDVLPALTGIGGLLFNMVGVAIDLAFGFIGGLIGGAIFGVRRAIV
jgi:hypothetical protein